MDLYSLLACPHCKVGVQRQGDNLVCPQCDRTYPVVNGVPVLLPDGSIPSTNTSTTFISGPPMTRGSIVW